MNIFDILMVIGVLLLIGFFAGLLRFTFGGLWLVGKILFWIFIALPVGIIRWVIER